MKQLTNFTILILFMSCTNIKQFESYELIEVEYKNINDSIPGITHLGKGEVWRMWEGIYKTCMNSPLTKDRRYLGMSNSVTIGTIQDNKNRTINLLDSTVLSTSELQRVILNGNSASCSIVDSVDFNIQSQLGLNFGSFNLELRSAFANTRYNRISIDSWVLSELVIDRFKGALSTNQNEEKKNFIRGLLNGKNRLVTHAIKIDSFSIDAVIDNSFDLSFIPDSTIINGSSALGNIDFAITKNKNNTLTLKSNDEFVIFCRLYKFKRKWKL